MTVVRLTWGDPNGNEDGAYVYRDTSPLDTENPGNLPAPIATLAPNVTTWDDENAVAGATYYYAVAYYKGSFVNCVADIQVDVSANTAQVLTLAVDSPSDWTLTEGDTRAVSVSSSSNYAHIAAQGADLSPPPGVYYFEIEVVTVPTYSPFVGVRVDNSSPGATGSGNAGDAGRYQWYGASGEKRSDGNYEAYGSPFGEGDIVGISVDTSNGEMRGYLNGIDQGLMFTLTYTTVLPMMFSVYNSSGTELKVQPSLSYLPAGAQPWPLA